MSRKRQKSQLVKIMESDDNAPYHTTTEDCLMWFNVINREVFNNKLSPVDEIDIRWRRGAHAYYISTTDTKDPDYSHTKLCMNKRYQSKKFFVEVLAHELVHHYQFLTEGKISHGDTFTDWTETFNKKGLRLEKAY
jgi:predicted SprT family Zn-dependent metalloprotease